jgi:CO dehydrogenase nickel-insertion accessory protein CooC1
MAKHIALAGKGGTGKTTVASLIIKNLVAGNKGRVLAVDADPNATLHEALGMELTCTLSDIVETVKEQKSADDSAYRSPDQPPIRHLHRLDRYHRQPPAGRY